MKPNISITSMGRGNFEAELDWDENGTMARVLAAMGLPETYDKVLIIEGLYDIEICGMPGGETASATLDGYPVIKSECGRTLTCDDKLFNMAYIDDELLEYSLTNDNFQEEAYEYDRARRRKEYF